MSSAAIPGRTPGYCPLQRGVRRHGQRLFSLGLIPSPASLAVRPLPALARDPCCRSRCPALLREACVGLAGRMAIERPVAAKRLDAVKRTQTKDGVGRIAYLRAGVAMQKALRDKEWLDTRSPGANGYHLWITCRLTAYEFSGTARANARVVSAATRG